MDDVDAVQAQIARNMLQSGDWVTARLDGVAYLEKPPLIYWMMAVSYRIFGVHDWAARIPLALSIILLCWVVLQIWALGLRRRGRLLCRARAVDLRWTVSLHPDTDSGRDFDFKYHDRDLGLAPVARTGRRAAVGAGHGCWGFHLVWACC